ncbi:hypothetical protein Nos7524_3209 [Nostoc sp. PCC 7524]|uniref:hypothetical protein n=1 Tax=Nostoc sp. (strain ATCC 29411 / PCC 7524) TaxID=28072 RepID=UPI00029F1677|nr:hypothetical protein [Nostoc sp. PCC 7524]AFY49009.1 hypothetical protein Nos7524_3209 [Nostoc sp. PCC 7524]
MNSNNVIITLQANDQASVVIRRLSSQLDGGLTRSLGRATLGANLMTQAITAGLQAVGNIASRSVSLFREAATTQTSIIATAGNVMRLAGFNFRQATAFVEDFQTEMARVAASLPGMASDFTTFGRGIIDDVIPAFVGLDGRLDSIERRAALDRLGELSKFGTLLGQTAGIDSTRASTQAALFLSGSRTLNELKQLDLFEKNTTFRNEVERLLGGRDLRRLSGEERQRIFLQAARLDEEVLEALSESVEGVFGLINDRIFGLETGFFGFMRDLDKNTEGRQTALKSINRTLLAVFGTNGFFDTLYISLKNLGISIRDPMLALSNAADSFTNTINYVTGILRDFNVSRNIDSLKGSLFNFFNNLINFEGLGAWLAEATNQGLDFLSNLDWSSILGFVGVKLAEIFNEIFRFIIKLDFTKILDLIIKILGGLFIGLGKFLSTIDWGALLLALGKLLGYALLGAVGAVLSILVAPVVASIGTLGLAIAGAIIGLLTIVAAHWDKIGINIRRILGNLVERFRNLQTNIQGIWNTVVDSVTSFFHKLVDWFQDLISKIPGFNLRVNEGLSSGIINNIPQSVPNSAGGRLDGLIAAAIRETKAAPPGSGLVVANTSEAILNRKQQAALLNNIGSRGGININSLIINTKAQDARGIAKDIMRAIADEYRNYSQNNLAIAF